MTIQQMISKSHELGVGLLGALAQLSSHDFVKEYVANYQLIDGYVNIKWGRVFETYVDNATDWHSDCQSWIFANINKFDKIWRVLNEEYNPIFNLDVTEKETINNNGGYNVERVNGSRNDSWQDVNGNQHASTDTHDKTVPYDGGGVHDRNVGTVSTSYDGYTNNGVTTKGEQIDKDGQTHNDNTVIERKRQGNQGVTSTQSMIKEELDIANYNFWDMLFSDIFDDLAKIKGVCTYG